MPPRTRSQGEMILSGTPYQLAKAGGVDASGQQRPASSEEQVQYPATRRTSGGFGYGDWPPNIEAPWVVRRVVKGFGQEIWQAGADRYFYGFVDARIPNQITRPPQLNSQAFTAEDRIRDVFERDAPTTTNLFACMGRYIVYWTNPTSLTSSLDLGTGLIAVSAENFQGASQPLLTYVAVEASGGMPQPYRTFTAASPTTAWALDTQATSVTPQAAIYSDDGTFTEDTVGPMTLTLSSLIGADDFVYLRGTQPFEGLNVNMNATNGSATTLTATYFNGSSFTSLSATDGTSSSSASFGQDGNITWTLPTDWEPNAINGTTGYHVRLAWSANFDSSVTTTDIDLIQRNTAAFFGRLGSALYRVIKTSTNFQLHSSHDGGLDATWTNVGTITDLGNPITGMYPFSNIIVFTAETGLFILEGDGSTISEQVWPHPRTLSDAISGIGGNVWRGMLWIPSGRDLYALKLSGGVANQLIVDDTVGPGRLTDNNSPARGRVTAFVGDDYYGYAVVQDESNVSYLLSYDVNESAWHSLLNLGAITVRHMWVSDVGHATNPLLYFNAGDDLRFIVLPRSSPNPLSDSACRFDSGTSNVGEFHMGRFYSPLDYEVKAWLTGKALGEDWTASDDVTFSYRTTDDGSYTDLDTFETDPIGQANFATSASSRFIEVKLTLGGTTDTTTPIVRSVYTSYAVRYPFKRIFTYGLHLADNQAGQHGSKRYGSAQDLRSTLNTSMSSSSPITLQIPDTGDSFDVIPVDFRIYTVFNETAVAWEWHASVQLAEHQGTTFGTHVRLGAFTHAQLAAFAHADLVGL